MNAPMLSIARGVCGTVQGVLAASRHVLWYVDWQTRGR